MATKRVRSHKSRGRRGWARVKCGPPKGPPGRGHNGVHCRMAGPPKDGHSHQRAKEHTTSTPQHWTKQIENNTALVHDHRNWRWHTFPAFPDSIFFKSFKHFSNRTNVPSLSMNGSWCYKPITIWNLFVRLFSDAKSNLMFRGPYSWYTTHADAILMKIKWTATKTEGNISLLPNDLHDLSCIIY